MGGEMVKLTERAVARIQAVISDGPAFTGLRVGLTDGGCSGYTYLMEFEASPDEDDLVFEQGGAKVFVHPLHLPYIAGSALDWAEGDLQSGFQLDNPNVKRMCGCGESFDV
jgi:iron-sulfur cluster assembly protein